MTTTVTTTVPTQRAPWKCGLVVWNGVHILVHRDSDDPRTRHLRWLQPTTVHAVDAWQLLAVWMERELGLTSARYRFHSSYVSRPSETFAAETGPSETGPNDSSADGCAALVLIVRVSAHAELPSGYSWALPPQSVPLTPQPWVNAEQARRHLQLLSAASGFSAFGVTRPQLPAHYAARYAEWIEQGHHADMHFLAERAAERSAAPLAEARSVIVLACNYAPEPNGAAGARIARYARGRDYHDVIGRALLRLRQTIGEHGGGASYASVDTGPVLERAYAEQAGLGWIGKNGMLITRAHGSYAFLATLWTQLDLPADAPHSDYCGTCSACLDGCPTQAFVQPGLLDARRCISNWTIDHRGELPVQAQLHGWLFGCDVCQEVCPWNRFAHAPALAAFAAPDTVFDLPTLVSSEGQVPVLSGTALRRAGALGLQRNARRLLRVLDDEPLC